MSTTPLRVTVYPNLQYNGAGGDPFINMMTNAMRDTVSGTDNKNQDGWNPIGQGLLKLPNFNFNTNFLWLLAVVFVISAFIISKRK